MDKKIPFGCTGVGAEGTDKGPHGCMFCRDVEFHGPLLKEGLCAVRAGVSHVLMSFHVIVHGGLEAFHCVAFGAFEAAIGRAEILHVP